MQLRRSITAAGVTAAMLLATGLTGCAANSGSGDGPVELDIWHRPGSLGEDTMKAAEAAFPDYDLTFVPTAGIDESLRAALRAKSGLPDIAYFGGTLPDYFQVEDQLLDLNDYGFAEHEDEYFTVALTAASSPSGRQIVAPTDIGPWVYFYNSASFAELGLPTEPDEVEAALADWDDYFDLAQKAGDAGMRLCDSVGGIYQLYMHQNGYMYFEGGNGEELTLDVDTPLHREAYDNAVRWAQAGLCGDGAPFSTEWSAAVTQGQTAGYVGAGWTMGILKDAAQAASGDWRIASGTPGGIAGMAGSYVGAFASTEYPDEAAEVVEFLASEEALSAGYVSSGLIPSTIASYDNPEVGGPDEFFGGQEVMNVMRETTEEASIVPVGPNGNTIMSRFIQALVNVTNGADPDEEWDAALAETENG